MLRNWIFNYLCKSQVKTAGLWSKHNCKQQLWPNIFSTFHQIFFAFHQLSVGELVLRCRHGCAPILQIIICRCKMQLIDLLWNIFLNHFWSFGSGSGRLKFHSKSIVIRITPVLPVFSAIATHARIILMTGYSVSVHAPLFQSGCFLPPWSSLKFKSQNNEQQQTTPIANNTIGF